MKINGIEYEWILTGDSPRHKDCLVALLGHDQEKAVARYEQMLTNPTEDDINLMADHTNFRLERVESSGAWWNDKFLAN